MKNNKGITLISLVVMIIVILILVSVATTTGFNVIKESKFNRAVSEMKTMQTKINEIYEEYRSGEISNAESYGSAISSSIQDKAEIAINSVDGNINNLDSFRYYSADYIKETLGIDGVDGDYLVNLDKREVILLNGAKDDDTTYYSLSQIENEQYNVEFINPTITYSPDGGKYILPKNITSEKTLNMNIELSLQDIPNSMTANDLTIKYAWSTSKDSEPSSGWVQLQNGTTISENGESNIDSAGDYYLWTKVEDENGKTLNTIVSKKYTVKDEYDVKVRLAFDANGGTVETNNKNAINQEPYGDLPTPTRKGYEFNGWYTDKTGETKVEKTDNVELDESNLPPTQPQSQTLYAGWTANQYDVVFNDKLPDEYQEVEYITSNVSSSSHPYINTYILPNSNMRVILKGKTGNQITSAGFLFGSRVTMHQQRFWGIIDQSKYRYGLGNGLNVNIASATTSQDFTFDFNFNESHSMKVNSLTTDSVTINDTNYNFPIFLFGLNNNGTLDSSQQKSFSVYEFTIYNSYEDVNPIMKLIPCYRRIDNEIGMYDLVEKRFYTNAGTGEFAKGPEIMPKQQFTYDTAQNITTNGYIKEGYSFTGWNTNSDGTGTSYTDGQSVTNLTTENNGTVNLYAEWEANKYKVKFNSNEGTGTMSDQQFTYDTAQNLIANTFTRTGYTFAGWNTAADRSGTSYINEQEVSNLTAENNGIVNLYAQWTPHEYDVVFNGNRLPAEYQEVEYIKSSSDGGQYIDTGISGNNDNLIINIKYIWDVLPPNGVYQNIISSYCGSEDSNASRIIQYGSTATYYNLNTIARLSTRPSTSRRIGVLYDEILTKDYIEINGNKTEITRNTKGDTNNNNIHLWSSGQKNAFASSLRIYGVKIYDGNTLLRDFIPCYLKTNNETIGLYDTVERRFYTNQGTGTFEKGNDANTQHFAYGTEQNLTTSSFTRVGYTFVGWNTSPDGTGTSYTDGQSVTNLTTENNGIVNLYAQWEVNKYNVLFNNNCQTLPSEYQEVEYIESTGTQYIDTGIIPTENMGFDVKMSCETPTASVALFGARWSDSPNYETFGMIKSKYTSSGYIAYFGRYDLQHYINTSISDDYMEATLTTRNLNINNNSFNITRGIERATTPIYVFGWNQMGELRDPMSGRIYSLRFTDNNRIVCDLIPCYRKSDNEVGMYDIINNVFYTNQGTGTFIKGEKTQQFTYNTAQNLTANDYTREGYTFAGWNTAADGSGTSYTDEQSVNNLISDPNGEIVLYAQWTPNQYDVVFNGNRLPSEYQEVEYITQSRSTAYINTRIVPNRNMRVVFKGKTNSNSVSSAGYLFGADNYMSMTHTNKYKYSLGDSDSVAILNAEKDQNFVLDFNYNETHDMKISKNGSAYTSVTGPNISESEAYSHPIFLLGRNNNGNLAPNYNPLSVYEFIIYNHYEDTDPSLHLIPCYRKSDNVIGMYDLVNNSFYSNAGTGAFEKGPDGTHQRFTYGTAQNLTVNTYTRDGYRFAGWNTVADGSGTSYTDGQEANNLTSENNGTVNLYAQWEENNYTVVFRKNELQHELPGEFRELEYIEGTGTQWINTNYALWNDSNWKIENKFEISEHYNYNNMFGPADVSEITNEVWIASDKNYYVRLNGTGKVSVGALDINTPYTFTLDNTGSNLLAYINGKQEKVLTKANTSTPRNIAYAHRDGVNYFKGRTYYLKFWSNGNLVRDFIPCYSTIQITDANGKECPSGTAGLYDTVNNMFYASSGEGEFIRGTDLTGAQEFSFTNPQNLNANTFTRAGYTFAGWNTKADGSGTSYTNGQSVNSLTTDNNGIVNLYAQWTPNQYNVVFNKNKALPNGYQEVEYIEGTGTQYINTNYKLWKDTNWKIENKFDVTGHYNYNNMFGLSGVTDTNNEMWIDNSRNYYIRVGGVPKTSIGIIDLNKPYTITHDNTGINFITYVNGAFTNSLIKSNTNRDYNLLYGHRDGATYLKGKTYYLKLWSNGEIVRDFVPCYRISDGEAGLFDIIENNFYPSAGSGKFVKGPDVTSTINGTMATQQLTYGTSQNLTSNSYTREGSTFDGWRDDKGNLYTDGQSVNSLTTENGGTVNLYAQWTNYQAYFDGNNSSSKLAEITDLTNIKRFEKYTGDNSNVQALINNGTAVKIDDNTTLRSIYAWYDENGNDDISDNEDDNTIYWWTDADRACLLDKSHYMWKNLTNAEYIDVTGIDTSKVTNMSNMFVSAGYNADTFEIIGLGLIDTSKVTNMSNMFFNAGHNSTTWSIGDLSQWDTSKVTTMQAMFDQAGYNSTTFDIGNIRSWNTSSVNTMQNMFIAAGRNSTTWNIGNIGSWNVSKVTNMSNMFSNAGYSATTWNIGNISSWNVSKVTNMSSMFQNAGYRATTWSIGDLSGWTLNTTTGSTINMSNMFSNAGYNATTFDIGNIGEWNTLNVTSMDSMFWNAGKNATIWNVGDLSEWNVANVTNMKYLFANAGYSATTWNIGNIGNWNLSKVTYMSSMFSSAGYKATTWSIGDLSGWTLNTTENSSIDMNSMFQNAGYSATIWNIGNIGSWNTSNVTNMTNMFNSAGYSATTWNIGDISNWNTSKVTSLAGMFNNAGYSATTWNIGNLERKTINGEDRWNTSNVTNMQSVFRNAGYSATTWNIGNIGNWNVSKVMYMHQMFQGSGYGATSWSIGNLSTWALNTAQDSSIDMHSMFQNAGRNAETWNIGNIGNWNTLNVTNMANMFDSAGYSATTWNIGNIGNWNLSNVTDMSMMFSGAGYSATTWYIGDLSGWTFNTTNEVNMRYMFNAAGYSAEEWSIGDISNWNLSKVTNMSHMFSSAGSYSQTWNLDLSNWTLNTTTDVTMDWMFWNAGRYSTTWSIGDISNWDTSKVTNMNGMFYYAGYDAQTWDSFNSLKIYANNISEMFRYCPKANGTLSIYNNPTSYGSAFGGAAISGSGIIVNYTNDVTNIDNIIATKSANSNVTKGNLIN